jgi:hypothetical protein
MGLVRGLDAGAIPLARPADVALAVWGGEYDTMGNLRDLLLGVDLSRLEAIWDKMEQLSARKDDRRQTARQWRAELAAAGPRLRP